MVSVHSRTERETEEELRKAQNHNIVVSPVPQVTLLGPRVRHLKGQQRRIPSSNM